MLRALHGVESGIDSRHRTPGDDGNFSGQKHDEFNVPSQADPPMLIEQILIFFLLKLSLIIDR